MVVVRAYGVRKSVDKPLKGKSVGDGTLKLFDCTVNYMGLHVFKLYSAQARHPTESTA